MKEEQEVEKEVEEKTGKKPEKDILNKLKGKFTRDNFLIMVLIGILFLVIVWPTENNNSLKKSQSGNWDSESDILKTQTEMQTDTYKKIEILDTSDDMLSYSTYLENSLERLLSTMEGVGKVRVMVTLENLGETIVEKDIITKMNSSTEVDSAGGSRNTSDVTKEEETIYTGSGSVPFVKQVYMPRVSGVVVSAQGGGDIKIEQNITRAIQALFGIEAHKIIIVKMISS